MKKVIYIGVFLFAMIIVYLTGYSQGQVDVYEKAKNDNTLNHMRYSK